MPESVNSTYFRYYIFPLLLWAALVGGSCLWNLSTLERNSIRLVSDRARAFFNIIETHRLWNAMYGGVYVPVSEKTKPNPYLEDPLRELTTVNGIELTKINPAYMTRQVAGLAHDAGDVLFNITSLKPIRPGNRADKWEAAALEGFEQGAQEALELVYIGSKQYYRYMAPLLVKKACLSCHAKQGYKEGDIRGGISVSMPAQAFVAIGRSQKSALFMLHAAIFFVGAAVLLYFQQRARKDANVIRQSLAVKDVLLKEIHHRVKNNLAMVSAMLQMQLKHVDGEDMRKIINDNQGRIKSIALVHEMLYQSRDLDSIDVRAFIENLVGLISRTFKNSALLVSTHLEVESVIMDIDELVAAGLILNEAITNSYKYGFIDRATGEVRVEMKESPPGEITLAISDNGVGFSEGFDHTESNTLGLRLIRTLARQLKAQLEVSGKGGVNITLRWRRRSNG